MDCVHCWLDIKLGHCYPVRRCDAYCHVDRWGLGDLDTTQVVGACFTLTGENFSEFTSDLNITVSIFRKICRKFLDFDNAVDRILTSPPTTCFMGAVEAVEAAVPMNSRQ